MPSCAVSSCRLGTKRNPNKSVRRSLFRFPKYPQLRQLWINCCGRKDDLNLETARICSQHFCDDDFDEDLRAKLLNIPPKLKLKHDAVPTLNLGVEASVLQRSQKAKNRSKRIHLRNQKKQAREYINYIWNSHINEEDQAVNVTSNNISVEFTSNRNEKSGSELCKNDSFSFNNVNELHIADNASTEKFKNECSESINENNGIETSTEAPNILNECDQKLIDKLLQKIVQLEKQILEQKELIESYAEKTNSLTCQLGKFWKVFTPAQMKMILSDQKTAHWSEQDMKNAFTLCSFSKKGYLFLKNTLHYPLPGMSTLGRWASKFETLPD